MRFTDRGRRLPAVCILLFFGAVVAPLSAMPKAEVEKARPLTVTVTGRAVEQVVPDTAILRFAVEIRNPSTTQGVQANQRMTDKIVAAIKKQPGTRISVAPYQMVYVPAVFVPALGTNQPVEFRIQQKGSYKVTTDIQVTVHDMASLPKIVDTALTAGVDRIDPIEYESSRSVAIAKTLVPEALADALAKAKALAADTGMALGPPIAVTSLESRGGRHHEVPTANAQGNQFTPPKLSVETRVHVVYEAKRSS